MSDEDRLAWVGQQLKREMSRMSRNDPALCRWLDEMTIAAKAMTHPIVCSHRPFRGGSGDRGNSGWVYVVDAPGSGLAKIGYSGPCWLDRRLRDVQSASPVRLNLIAVGTGGTQLEAHWHQQFKAYRRHLEWFEADAIVPFFRAAMAEAPSDGCARCSIMKDRLPEP